MGIFKQSSANDPRRKAAILNAAFVIALCVITTVALFLNFEGEDPCADRTNLTVEEVWACDGVTPERRE